MLSASLRFALPAVLLLIAAAPPSAVNAPTEDPVVVEIDTCQCESVLKIESGTGDMSPWLVSWTVVDGNEHGRCAAGACDSTDARPCKGKFRIMVSWPATPTAPCITEASVSYRPEGSQAFYAQGKLDLSHGFVPIDDVGGNLVICATRALGEDPFEEPNDSTTEIYLTCGKAGGLAHTRLLKVTESCVPCIELPSTN